MKNSTGEFKGDFLAEASNDFLDEWMYNLNKRTLGREKKGWQNVKNSNTKFS